MRRMIVLVAVMLLLFTIIPITSSYVNNAICSRSTMIAEDTAPPIISLQSPPNGSVVRSLSFIDIDVEDNSSISHVLYNWDLGTNYTIETPYMISVPADEGEHYLFVYANDTAANSAIAIYQFAVDDTPPVIQRIPQSHNLYNIDYLQNFGDFDIRWYVFDENPGNYSVLINGTLVGTGIWSHRVAIVGVVYHHDSNRKLWYNCTLILSDAAGNTVVNSTLIYVYFERYTSTNGTDSMLVFNLMVAGSITAVLALFCIRRDYKSRSGW